MHELWPRGYVATHRVVKVRGYGVQLLSSDQMWRCHIDHRRKCGVEEGKLITSTNISEFDPNIPATAAF